MVGKNGKNECGDGITAGIQYREIYAKTLWQSNAATN